MLHRIFQILIDSFISLYREKFSFYISSFTISICLILVSLVSTLSIAFVQKIQGIEMPELIVSYSETLDNNCIDVCPYNDELCPECPIYVPSKLELKGTDSKSDKDGKTRCKECLDKIVQANDKIWNFKCDDACTPDKESDYIRYYGSKQNTDCGTCLDRQCDKANNEIMQIQGISKKTGSVYKEDALRIWEDLSGESYLARKHVTYIDFPMYGEFTISEEIDNKGSLYALIKKIEENKFVNNVNDEDMIDVESFFFYKKLINIIVSAAIMVIIITLLIPFSIVSNTIHLIIYSKKEVISTLKILGEKDFFIKLPFVFQGIWQGVIGSFFALIFIFFLDILESGNIVSEFLNTAISSSENLKISLVYSFEHVFLILLLGTALGVFGSLRSIARYIK